ncbi:MAG: adenosine deaminase family protein [Methyloceanibacter sp.]|uniref:adenosine deaminase family protein n=1 Tax=Methyloceanibacter sp. TaxID=1965321 RepID=UPI003D6D46A0
MSSDRILHAACCCRVIAASLCLGLWLLSAVTTAKAEPSAAEQSTAQALDKLRDDPLRLHEFLFRMPKGADLHSHLHSAVYAETLIADAVDDGLCIDPASKSFAKAQPVAAGAGQGPVCEQGDVPAATVYQDQDLYNALIDAFSMRGFVPSEGETGHDHFFGAFQKFGGTNPSHTGEWLDEVAARAARQNLQYLELMATPTWHRLNDITKDVAWRDDLASLRDELLAKGLAGDIPAARAFWDQAEATRNARGDCEALEASPACNVELRYIYEVFRSTPKELVFAQALFGFMLAAADPRVVAINFVGEEDGHTAMTDYAEHMRMVGYLRDLYPDVHVSLHAGELAPGLVPPEGLCCHIRLAVEQARSDRIGHGVDIMYEDAPYELMKLMADRGVLVEINLTSNADVLGVSGKHHPFPIYRAFKVPVALSTDDAGIERIDLTHEYVRAVETYGLSYADLKEMVRNSLEFGFLSGTSLWAEGRGYTTVAPACAGDALGAEAPSQACAAFLEGSEKATQQWGLEWRFRAFEASH